MQDDSDKAVFEFTRRGAPEAEFGAGVDDMRHAENRKLVRYWHGLRGARVCPMRAEVDPRRISAAIGNLFILEDLGRGNVRFRLAGSALVDAFWMELRGLPIQSIMAAEARQSMRELVAETLAEPGIGMARLKRADATSGGLWEMALLPLRSDRGQIDRVLGALNPFEPAEARPSDPPLVFSIDEMAITPVEGAVDDVFFASAGQRSGFAEAAVAFDGAPSTGDPAAPLLRSISGGLSAKTPRDGENADDVSRRRASIRLVHDSE
ncbi:MAG: PAS domain-containing protein [Pseudomonadota bacterium]